ncbi:MAG TPA: TIGR01777 family oxidoreductase [Thermoanaerobaculia bacterium]|nr:TIGR01777 family oxidoreductase [Thermoanaerobaculia bacterium]
MKIVVAGGTGFLGEPLVQRLVARGDDVTVLTRNPQKVETGRGVHWDGKTQGAWSEDVAAADLVINLAGENISEGRWTEERKRRLIDSRLHATTAIVQARPRTLINASAVGIYGDRGDEVLDERSPRGSGFLAELVDQWENAARAAESFARLVIIRFGIVLAPDGGALKKLLLPFKLGVGGPIGSGKQWMSWVDREDALRLVEWAIANPNARGVYNATAPEPLRNRELSRTLAHALHRPAILPTPPFALRLLFGEMADEALLAGQRAVPRRALDEGFGFERPTLADSLAAQL